MGYVIVQAGGKQHRVSKGDTFRVEKMPLEVGQEVVLDKVLAAIEGEKREFGTPYLQGKKVVCEVLAQEKGEKILAFKFRPKKHSKQLKGHRQRYTALKVRGIE